MKRESFLPTPAKASPDSAFTNEIRRTAERTRRLRLD